MKALINQLQFELNDIKMSAEQKAVITTLIDQIEQENHKMELKVDKLVLANGINQMVIKRFESGYKKVEKEVDKIAADLKTTKQWT